MKATLKATLHILPLLIAGACDTTEDAYWPGPEPTDILSADVAEIHLNADGTPRNVNIAAICSWEASLTDNENVFTIAPATGKGNGVISVSADRNYGGSVKTSSIVVKARNFTKQITVNLMQSSLTFGMESKDYPVVGEEGGVVNLSFNSTTGWMFEVRPNSADPNDVGDLDWFDFVPDISGDGDFYKTEVQAQWKPNYTTEERVITLALTPTNKDILEYITPPEPFKLKQKGGTTPMNVVGDTVSVTKTNISYRLSYVSNTPVIECGVKVFSGSGEELITVAANKDGDTYPQNGEVSVNIDGLEEGATYLLTPYVINIVGETKGVQKEIRTKADILGATISNYDLTINTRSVSVRVTVESDANVTEVGFSIYNDINQDQPLATYTHSTSGLEVTEEISSTDFMTPNTDYEIMIFARTPVNEARTERIPIHTRGMNPDEDDNNRPDIEL